MAMVGGVDMGGGLPINQAGYEAAITPRITAKIQADLEREKMAMQQGMWQQQLAFYQDILGQRNKQAGTLGSVVGDYNKAFAEAQAANEAKYKEALGLTDQVSGQQAADIRSSYTKQRSSALQNLARSGMSGTTVGSTLQQGLGREETSALTRLSDQLLQQKLGVMQGFNYQEPNAQIPTALIQALSQNISWPSF